MKYTTAAIVLFLTILLLGATGSENRRLPDRTEDPVIIPGKSLPGLAGTPVGRLGLFRYESKFVPIPFQLDERDQSGAYVFTSGPITGSDQVPGLDDNDELVFMAFDTGGKAPAASIPPGAGAGAEVEITDPVTGESAYAYLFRFAADPPRSSHDYVSYSSDPAKGIRVQAQTYIIRHPPGSIYYTYQSLLRPDGTWTQDLADRLKIRGGLSALMGIIDAGYQFDDLVKSRVTGWIDGPVRIVRRGEGYLKVAGMDIRGNGDSIGYYYPSWFIYPMMIDFPVNLRTYLTDITIHGATDFTRAAFGAHYYDAQNPYSENVVFDGKMSVEEKKLKLDHDHGWLALVHPQWASVHRLFFPKEWASIKKFVYYRDDPGAVDPPEDDPGEFAAGYEFTNFISVSKGPITYYMHYYFPANFKVGDEKRILDVVDRPIKTRVTAIPGK